MNAVEAFLSCFEDDNFIMHEGVSILDGAPGRGSGRYPLGSGQNPNQHRDPTFLSRVKEMKKKGMTETQIAEAMGIYDKDGKKPSSGRLRTQIALANHAEGIYKADRCRELKKQGYNNTEIARMLDLPGESSVRNYLNQDSYNRRSLSMTTAELLKEMVDSYKTDDTPGMVDVGDSVEKQLSQALGHNLSKEKLNEALYILELEGYPTYSGRVKQVTNKNQFTTQKVLCTPGTKHKQIWEHENVKSVLDYDKVIIEDPKTGNDKIVKAFMYPESLDSKRIHVRYAEDGGKELDGTIEIRRGVPDLSLGDSHYAQVRILVDGTHYIKGMAVYGEDKDFPPGTDVIINSNKPRGTKLHVTKQEENNGAMQVLKTIKNDPDNPFGSYIKSGINDPGSHEHGGQSLYIDPKDGKEKLSLINKRSDEGDWSKWGKELPTQFLAKQPKEFIKRQISISLADKDAEYQDIMALNNPTVKKKLLMDYANKCDAAAMNLKAAPLPNGKYQVILPVRTLKDNECFAPNYEIGEKLALIRFPHQGTFEIPIVTVNNNNKEGISKITKNAKDAIGININVADRLSGADFDGDSVLVVPLKSGIKLKSTDQLEGLKDYNPKVMYGAHEKKEIDGVVHYYRYGKEFKPMSHDNTQRQMGITTNLLTDMTIQGATEEEITRAVKHALLVIDAEKHGLDYQASYKDNRIAELKKKYQPHKDDDGYGGASTIFSRAKSAEMVDKRQGTPNINQKGKPWYDPSRPEGALIYKTADDDKLYYKKVDPKTGEVTTAKRLDKSSKMKETDDAHTLSSGYYQEEIYADYANKLKSMANKARLDMVNTGNIEFSKTAERTYRTEVDRLNAALNLAELNKPKERQALRKANMVMEDKVVRWKEEGRTSKEIKEDYKKEAQRAMTAARAEYNSKRQPIVISAKEWEAIQAGAISENKLRKILDYADMDSVRKLATPRGNTLELPKYQQKLIKLRAKNGYTNEEIAASLGISTSTVNKYL